jgi:hypothetical protein
MATYFGNIEVYFVNVLSPNPYAGRRLMNVRGSFGKAILWFMPNDSTLPANRKRSGQNVFDVYYHMDAWEAILDVLRNEKPVFFSFHDTNNAAQIYTGEEPVGEGEDI